MNYEDMHWTQLKKLVEDRGEAFTTKQDAVKYLTNNPLIDDATIKEAIPPLTEDDLPVEFAPMASEPSPPVPEGTTQVTGAKQAALDKSKPYGEIMGSVAEAPGARYTQGGKFFNAKGDLVG